MVNARRDDQSGNVRFFKVADRRDLTGLLARMYSELRIGSVLVEGGSNLLQQFIDAGLWDEIYRCVSPQRFGAGVKAPILPAGLAPTNVAQLGVDRLEGYTS